VGVTAWSRADNDTKTQDNDLAKLLSWSDLRMYLLSFQDICKEGARTQSATALRRRNDKEPTARRTYTYQIQCMVNEQHLRQAQLEKTVVNLTLRPWGNEGAGIENLPRAATPWNSHSGMNIILGDQSNEHLVLGLTPHTRTSERTVQLRWTDSSILPTRALNFPNFTELQTTRP
jgi:hypothetical protein